MVAGIQFNELTGLILRAIAAVGACTALVMGLRLVHERLREKQQGFGPNAIKALGLVLFLPALVLVAVAVPSFNGQTLAALLGTVAGYVLSQTRPDEHASPLEPEKNSSRPLEV